MHWKKIDEFIVRYTPAFALIFVDLRHYVFFVWKKVSREETHKINFDSLRLKFLTSRLKLTSAYNKICICGLSLSCT